MNTNVKTIICGVFEGGNYFLLNIGRAQAQLDVISFFFKLHHMKSQIAICTILFVCKSTKQDTVRPVVIFRGLF